MPYEIPVVDDSNIVVCKVVWDGDLYEGEAKVVSVGGEDKVAQNVANAIQRNTDLRRLSIRSEGEKDSVQGWSGYEGVVGGLRIVLPSLGLKIGHVGGDVPDLGKKRVGEVQFNLNADGLE